MLSHRTSRLNRGSKGEVHKPTTPLDHWVVYHKPSLDHGAFSCGEGLFSNSVYFASIMTTRIIRNIAQSHISQFSNMRATICRLALLVIGT